MKKIILEINNLTKKFGSLVAINNVTFEVYENEILSVIGQMVQENQQCLN